jgi:preprotein translocase subunit SecF
MQLFPPGRVFRFMRIAPYCGAASLLLVLATLVALFMSGAKLGTDFVGGTELEVAFKQSVTTEQIRQSVAAAGFSTPDVVKVEDDKNPHRYLIRAHEVSIIPDAVKRKIERRLCLGENLSPAECPEAQRASEVKFSPGGEKINVRFRSAPDLGWIRQRLEGVPEISLRPGANNPVVQNARDHKVEVALLGTSDKIMGGLHRALGAAKVPDAALRAEWIGPKAGAQLRDAAIKSILIALVLIMMYVAFRFDLRFAPGAVLCLLHDAMIAVGALMLSGRELNLTTVAALLTIIGFSVNDTVVIYDRVRENLGRLRGASFPDLIDLSISEMLGRTILTSGTAIFSLLAFFVWGTGTLKDFAFTLIVGMISGVYSTVYIALPLTYWLDKTFFSKVPTRGQKKKRTAVVEGTTEAMP